MRGNTLTYREEQPTLNPCDGLALPRVVPADRDDIRANIDRANERLSTMTDQTTDKEPHLTVKLPISMLSFMLGLMGAENCANEAQTHRNARERTLVAALLGADDGISVSEALRQASVFMEGSSTIAKALEDVGY